MEEKTPSGKHNKRSIDAMQHSSHYKNATCDDDSETSVQNVFEKRSKRLSGDESNLVPVWDDAAPTQAVNLAPPLLSSLF